MARDIAKFLNEIPRAAECGSMGLEIIGLV